MTKDVLISIKGQDCTEGREEDIETIHSGQFFRKNDKVYIRYEEPVEGTGKKVNSMIKVGPEGVEMTMKGVVNSHMVFWPGRKITTCYEGPYGAMQMGIDTKQFDVSESEGAYELKLAYDMDCEGRYVSSRYVYIRVTPKEDAGFRLVEK
jgi:uncharacterized beta-barrel protein YwiB (DUF1934 family)